MGMCVKENSDEPAGPGSMHACWSCKGNVADRALFCAACGVVQPPGQIDHFARLGLPRSYAVDRGVLDKQYFGFQRRLHPDRFVMRTPREKALSQQQAIAVNEAYEVLRDPLRRAEYLLHLEGAGKSEGDREADPMLLMEMMERREELAEADTLEAIGTAVGQAERDVADCQKAMAAAFAENNLEQAEKLVSRLKYLMRLLEETRVRKRRFAGEKR